MRQMQRTELDQMKRPPGPEWLTVEKAKKKKYPAGPDCRDSVTDAGFKGDLGQFLYSKKHGVALFKTLDCFYSHYHWLFALEKQKVLPGSGRYFNNSKFFLP